MSSNNSELLDSHGSIQLLRKRDEDGDWIYEIDLGVVLDGDFSEVNGSIQEICAAMHRFERKMTEIHFTE